MYICLLCYRARHHQCCIHNCTVSNSWYRKLNIRSQVASPIANRYFRFSPWLFHVMLITSWTENVSMHRCVSFSRIAIETAVIVKRIGHTQMRRSISPLYFSEECKERIYFWKFIFRLIPLWMSLIFFLISCLEDDVW